MCDGIQQVEAHICVDREKFQMSDYEKVVRGLKICSTKQNLPCIECPYYNGVSSQCLQRLKNDALDLIVAQQSGAEKIIYRYREEMRRAVEVFAILLKAGVANAKQNGRNGIGETEIEAALDAYFAGHTPEQYTHNENKTDRRKK